MSEQVPEGQIPDLTHDVGVWGDKEDPSPTYADQGISEEEQQADLEEARRRWGDRKHYVSD